MAMRHDVVVFDLDGTLSDPLEGIVPSLNYALEHFGYAPLAVLRAYLPDYPWQEWRLPHLPPGFWEHTANRRRYLDWLGSELGYQQAEDWQQLRVTDLLQHHGERLLTLFQRQVSAIVNEYLHGGHTNL